MYRALKMLASALSAIGLTLALAPVAAGASSGTTYFRSCKAKRLAFGMKFHVISAYRGHVADRITYYITGTRSAKDSTIVFFQKGPTMFHRDKKHTTYTGVGESGYGEITNADSDGKWHPLDQRSFTMHPLPIGTFPWGGGKGWKLWYHYVVDIWPHGNGNAGCNFSFEVLGPSNAYFP
jgi:hypothetical protein